MSAGAERPPRPPWSEFRAALDAAGFRPSRRLGQNLLLDENSARAIVRDAAVPPGELVLEVGPGCGFLSVHLAHHGARLLAIEIDERLAPIAKRFLAPYPGARVLVGDALASKRSLAPELEALLPEAEPWHLVSNLPYSVGGPIMALCAGRENPPASMTVLIQEEVGERLCAKPGTRAWGSLSVVLQSTYRLEILRRLGPQLFWPRPRVSSAVVRGERLEPLARAESRARLAALAARLLSHRRQSLARILRELLGDGERAAEVLESLGWEPLRRPDTLGLTELEALLERCPALGHPADGGRT